MNKQERINSALAEVRMAQRSLQGFKQDWPKIDFSCLDERMKQAEKLLQPPGSVVCTACDSTAVCVGIACGTPLCDVHCGHGGAGDEACELLGATA